TSTTSRRPRSATSASTCAGTWNSNRRDKSVSGHVTPRTRLILLAVFALLVLVGPRAVAQERSNRTIDVKAAGAGSDWEHFTPIAIPKPRPIVSPTTAPAPPQDLTPFLGKTIGAVRVEPGDDTGWGELAPPQITRVKPGDPFTTEAARVA